MAPGGRGGTVGAKETVAAVPADAPGQPLRKSPDAAARIVEVVGYGRHLLPHALGGEQRVPERADERQAANAL